MIHRLTPFDGRGRFLYSQECRRFVRSHVDVEGELNEAAATFSASSGTQSLIARSGGASLMVPAAETNYESIKLSTRLAPLFFGHELVFRDDQ